MHRTQLLLEPWQHERLVALSEREGRSISSLVRDILSAHFEELRSRDGSRLEDIEGIAEGPPRFGRNHDDHLYGQSRER